MIKCTLNGKTYTVDFIPGRALREIGDSLDVLGRMGRAASAAEKGEEYNDDLSIEQGMDTLVKWFCLIFGNQFTPEDMYDYYPADRIMVDITTAVLAVNQQATNVLDEFPTKAAQETAKKA